MIYNVNLFIYFTMVAVHNRKLEVPIN